MGNSHEKSSEYKGPFGDIEYDQLARKYEALTKSRKSDDIHANFKTAFHLYVPDTMPQHLRTPLEDFGVFIYRLCALQNESNASDTIKHISLPAFVRAVTRCTRLSPQSILTSIYSLFDPQGCNAIERSQMQLLFLSVLLMMQENEAVPSTAYIEVTEALTTALMSDNDTVQSEQFVQWTTSVLPLLYSVISTWMSSKALETFATRSYSSPKLTHRSEILSLPQFHLLSCVTTHLQGDIDRIYTSMEDGLSYNRLCFHLLGYSGPTLIVIQDVEGAIFGAFCDTEWKESNRFYGGNGCFLFRFRPDFHIYRAATLHQSGNHMYLNTKGFSLPRGLGVGGDLTEFRMFLSEDFDENCYTTTRCLSYEPGPLSSRKRFSIALLEIWGCGGEKSMLKQKAHRQDTADMIAHARKVDKAQFVGNDFDKEMFLGRTFGHGTNQARVVEDQS
ncbi:unnamed protein product [Albugo candida]|uniref:TLDc domain-containing protein n=1 Tax=Albugo candida TaxID=65357 RepID=A0A024GQ13_9STRA|nr:unnamed protein product [Albugo candida]|eukprot:CCI48958.1 unnamed protein product [Albugo candida]